MHIAYLFNELHMSEYMYKTVSCSMTTTVRHLLSLAFMIIAFLQYTPIPLGSEASLPRFFRH